MREGPDTPAIEAYSIRKSFGHVQSLILADLVAHNGEVLGVVGDNGAGKSTLLKVLSGIYQPDAGEIKVHGQVRTFSSTSDAKAAGISTVHQDLGLVDVLDIATNLHLGDFPKGRLLVDRRKMQRDATAVLNRLSVRVGSVLTPVGMLSGGQRQIIAISRAVRLGTASVVLLDEPTAALGVKETAHVGEIIANLAAEGKAIVVISHDMQFVFRYADRIQVMRLGRTAKPYQVRDTNREQIVSMITGAYGEQTT